MELTIDQALQRGIEAHRAGKLQEADRYYTVILTANPKHPDANHNMGVLAVGVGKVEEALPFFKNALDANPNIDQFWLSYIDALIKLDRIDDAKEIFYQAKNIGAQGDGFDQVEQRLNPSGQGNLNIEEPSPEQVQYLIDGHSNGQYQQVLTEASQLLKEFPNSVNLYNIIGIINQKLRRLEAAIYSFKKALSIRPDFVDAHYNMGNVLKEQRKHEEAIEAYTKALSIKPDHVESEVNLSRVKNLAVPSWHIGMMNDLVRNNAYLEALKLAVSDGDIVLEIGTGSGLLAMMSANAGAKKVITCEISKTLAGKAKEIIKENSFEDKIIVINKISTDLNVGEDLPQKADIIISEIMSSEFVGEGVQSSIVDAKKRLLAKNGTMLPESGDIRVALIGDSEEIRKNICVNEINGFDFSKFNSIVGNKFPLKLKNRPNLLSKTKVAFKFDFYSSKIPRKKSKIISIKVNKSGLCYGIIQWLGIQIFKNIKYENKPGVIPSHWSTPIYIFNEPLYVNKGQEIKIKATLFEDSVWFSHHT